MKKLIIIYLLLLFCRIGVAQTILCNAVIYWKYEGIVNVYDKPNGEKMASLQNDIKHENFIGLTIQEQKDNFFLVEIQLAINGTRHTGWIERSEYIGAFMKHEMEYMDLIFYTDPNTTSSKIIELKHWKSGLITIEECNATWTKVTVTHEGKRITGWIKSVELCANNYSGCN